MPNPKSVAEAKRHPEAPGAFTSFRQLPRLYVGWPPPDVGTLEWISIEEGVKQTVDAFRIAVREGKIDVDKVLS